MIRQLIGDPVVLQKLFLTTSGVSPPGPRAGALPEPKEALVIFAGHCPRSRRLPSTAWSLGQRAQFVSLRDMSEGSPVQPEDEPHTGNGMQVETPPSGLSTTEVAERIARGKTNLSGERTSRTLGEILRANLVTRFNIILGTLLVAILAVGHLQDALFGIVLVANALIGIVQELRAKRTLDRLAVLNAPPRPRRARWGRTRHPDRSSGPRRPRQPPHG